MKFAAIAITALIPLSAMAEQSKPLTDDHVFNTLNIIAVPIGDRGMVVKDSNGCLWVLKNSSSAPVLVAVMGEEAEQPLCEKRPEEE